MTASELTQQWNSRYDKFFAGRLRAGDTPREAEASATRLTQESYKEKDPRGEWDGDMGCYIPWAKQPEDFDL